MNLAWPIVVLLLGAGLIWRAGVILREVQWHAKTRELLRSTLADLKPQVDELAVNRVRLTDFEALDQRVKHLAALMPEPNERRR